MLAPLDGRRPFAMSNDTCIRNSAWHLQQCYWGRSIPGPSVTARANTFVPQCIEWNIHWLRYYENSFFSAFLLHVGVWFVNCSLRFRKLMVEKYALWHGIMFQLGLFSSRLSIFSCIYRERGWRGEGSFCPVLAYAFLSAPTREGPSSGNHK